MAKELKKHKAVVFTGGRGSGKTLSMSTEGACNLIQGYNVWANYPLGFNFRHPSGEIKRYDAQEITIKDLGNFNPEIRNGYILLDELNLFLSSRRSQSLINHLANGWFQLLRKRKLSVYITCQFFHTLDRGIREQSDLIIECFDLSFKYAGLKPGQSISQMITSYSGYGTGRPLFKMDDQEQWKRNTRARILHGLPFWNVYDSWSEYDILKALTKYEVERETVVINGLEDSGQRTGILQQQSVNEMTQTIHEVSNNVQYSSDEMITQLAGWGIRGGLKQVGALLKKAGWEYDHRKGYTLNKLNAELVEV